MLCRRPISTTRRGTTLIELSVAVSIFLGMTTVLLTLMISNERAASKIVNHNDTTNQILVVFEKVRMEMKHSRVIYSAPLTGTMPPGAHPGCVQYWYGATHSGLPVLVGGMPSWQSDGAGVPEVVTLWGSQGELYRNFEGRTLPIADMGDDGSVLFDWDANVQTLNLSGFIGKKDIDTTRNNYQPYSFAIHINNNV